MLTQKSRGGGGKKIAETLAGAQNNWQRNLGQGNWEFSAQDKLEPPHVGSYKSVGGRAGMPRQWVQGGRDSPFISSERLSRTAPSSMRVS